MVECTWRHRPQFEVVRAARRADIETLPELMDFSWISKGKYCFITKNN